MLGLCADRYATGAGYYSKRDECQLTLIEGEALERMKSIHGVRMQNDEHRRNLVTRGLALRKLPGKRLRIGDVLLDYERPRMPCGYVERLTEKRMTRALGEGSEICMRVLRSGMLREGSETEALADPNRPAIRRLP